MQIFLYARISTEIFTAILSTFFILFFILLPSLSRVFKYCTCFSLPLWFPFILIYSLVLLCESCFLYFYVFFCLKYAKRTQLDSRLLSSYISKYRVIQEDRSILWKVIVSAIVSKKVHDHVSSSECLRRYCCLNLSPTQEALLALALVLPAYSVMLFLGGSLV
jgi:hypothetical protein